MDEKCGEKAGGYRSRPISVKLEEELGRFAVDRLCIIYESSHQGSRQRINYGSRTKSRETNLHPSKVNNTPFYPIVPRIRLHGFVFCGMQGQMRFFAAIRLPFRLPAVAALVGLTKTLYHNAGLWLGE